MRTDRVAHRQRLSIGRRPGMEPRARDVIGAALLTAFLIGLVTLIFFIAWQAAA